MSRSRSVFFFLFLVAMDGTWASGLILPRAIAIESERKRKKKRKRRRTNQPGGSDRSVQSSPGRPSFLREHADAFFYSRSASFRLDLLHVTRGRAVPHCMEVLGKEAELVFLDKQSQDLVWLFISYRLSACDTSWQDVLDGY